MKFVNIFLKGLLAGIAISFGGLVYIMTRKLIGNAVLGAYLFSIGLINVAADHIAINDFKYKVTFSCR